MLKKSLLACAAFSLLLAACGSSPKQLGTKTPTRNPQVEPKSCPQDLPATYHQVTLHFNQALPAKLGLKLDFDRDVRFSECANLTQSGPTATISRPAGTTDIVVRVVHNGFFNPLPRDVTFDLIDLQNCGNSTKAFYSLKSAPLFWRLEFPNGASCAGRAYASEVISTIE